MSFNITLTIPSQISGVVAMNGRIGTTILNQMYEQGLVDSRGLEYLPVFVRHGVEDSVIYILYGRDTRDHLKQLKLDR